MNRASLGHFLPTSRRTFGALLASTVLACGQGAAPAAPSGATVGDGVGRAATLAQGPNEPTAPSTSDVVGAGAEGEGSASADQQAPTAFASASAVRADVHAQAVPIFVITCDRLVALRRTLAGFRRALHTPYQVVIHDNHSTFPETVAYLAELEAEGIPVYRSAEPVLHPDALSGVAATVADWLASHPADFYVVTDPDIELEEGPGDLLPYFAHLLTEHPEIDVVGTMLRIDDLPDVYPLKDTVVARYRANFHHTPPFLLSYGGKSYPVRYGPVDTAFGMYRGSHPWHRLTHGLLTYAPYQARHLDWYLDPNALSDDQRYYLRRASDVSHWGGSWLREKLDAPS